MFAYNLGDKVQDKVTGFKGIVTTRSEFINGCIRYGVQSQDLKEGKTIDPEWFDERQLELVKKEAVKVENKRTGGPSPTPRQSPNPR